ncbi:MAG TPA: GNAT family N-acetyltransferase [Sphingomicrobium sp.]|nr:GNAT family N-acetyltransferase [Sphingomicrobium sp.]
MSIAHRMASEADLPAIDRVFRTGFCDTFGHLYRSEDLDAFLSQFSPQAWLAEHRDPSYAFRIAEARGDAVAFAKLGSLSVPVEPAGPALELRQLYVLRPWQGTGIAQQLMEWALAEARARGIAELYLTVYTDNHRARAFYRRYGFGDVGPYAFMVGSHADEDIIMRLAL